jgi:hypothetical protein
MFYNIILIPSIIISAISRKVKKRWKEKRRERHGFPDSVKEDVLHKQNHRCGQCNRVLNVVDWHHKNGDSQITRNQIVKPYVLTVMQR